MPMSTGNYFVSDEAEKAAKWDAFEELRQSREHRDALEDIMKKLGKALNGLAYAIQHPKECLFEIDRQDITIAKPPEMGVFAHVVRADFDWESVFKLLTDYKTTVQRISELE